MARRKILAADLVGLMLFLGCAALFFLVVVSRNYVPAKFLYDENTLRGFWNTTQTCGLWDKANGYVCTAIVYRTFNVTLEVAIGIAAVTIPAVFLLMPFGRAARLRVPAYAFSMVLAIAVAWGGAAAIFNSGLNKELLANIAIVFALLFVRRKRLILASVVMLFYGVYIRPYWVIVVAFAWAAHIVSRKLGPRWGLAALAVSLVSLTLIAAVVLHAPLSMIRAATNDYRVGSEDARSMITPFFNVSNPLLEAANMFVTWISLLLPWPLVMLGGVQQLIVVVLMPVTVYLIIKNWRRAWQSADVRCNFSCSLFFAFVTVQAVFEPDYGSFVRHVCGFVPFGLLAIGFKQFGSERVRSMANRQSSPTHLVRGGSETADA
ncbi:hypothetical protein [Chitinasiproducens palmae]|uniref:Uncharacterized protein n=1 Tax=Chitinasiproducens palmae TaxID=1770053 RepID=A0A1H2PPF3_9BURK|nr:hypothetical protein [Chitinasiproducens palmae]SDV48603.1 hypothetical protein SAMN05216551_105223 [Chitinasiproducens palmae]